MLKLIGGFTLIIAAIAAIAITAILGGYTLSILWSWFIVPALGLPALTIPSAIGIAIIVSYLTHQTIECEKPHETFSEGIIKSFIVGILKPLFALGIGYVIHLFM